MAPTTRVIGIDEAAAHLGESVSTIRRRIKRGEHVPGLMPKTGRKYRFSLARKPRFCSAWTRGR